LLEQVSAFQLFSVSAFALAGWNDFRWQGGAVEDLPLDLPVSAPDKVRYPETLVNRVRTLAATMTDTQITAMLNQEGLLS